MLEGPTTTPRPGPPSRARTPATAGALRVLLLACIAAVNYAAPTVVEHVISVTGPRSVTCHFQESADKKIRLTVIVNRRPAVFLVDTGASTMIDAAWARENGFPLRESDEESWGLGGYAGKQYEGNVEFLFDEFRIANFPVSYVDLSALREFTRKSGWPDFQGMIGSNMLEVLRARIDYGNHTVTFWRTK